MSFILNTILLFSIVNPNSPLDTVGVKNILKGDTLYMQGKYVESNDYYMKAAKQSKRAGNLDRYASSIYFIGFNLNLLGKYDSSLTLLTNSFEVVKDKLESPSDAQVYFLDGIARALHLTGHYDISLLKYAESLEIKRELYGSDSDKIMASYTNTGLVYWDKGDLNMGMEYMLKSLNLAYELFGKDHPNIARINVNLGAICNSLNRHEEAKEHNRKAIKIWLNTIGEIHPVTARAYNNQGVTYSGLGDHKQAVLYYKKCIGIRLKTLNPYHPELGTTYNAIGKTYYYMDSLELAKTYFDKTLDIFHKTFDHHAYLCITYHDMSSYYFKLNQIKKALQTIQLAIKFIDKKVGDNISDDIYSNPGRNALVESNDLLRALNAKGSYFYDLYYQGN
ncbi:tetratricopeptide repeat protein [Sphingobacteriaceae bacterium AH-315-L07]|nr:tetratricopeptide repeat protein [Bacteroidia bacterium]MBN4052391.1 tetratricopeptide repeat protein [Sphingobacteriaceae bacterium AH-315-L07]